MIPIGKCAKCGLWTYLRYKRLVSFDSDYYLSWPNDECPHCKFRNSPGSFDTAFESDRPDAIGLDHGAWSGSGYIGFYPN